MNKFTYQLKLHETKFDLKTILGEELYNQVIEATKGKGKDGKDLEVVLANTGDYVLGSKLDALRAEYDTAKAGWNGEKAILEKNAGDKSKIESELADYKKTAEANMLAIKKQYVLTNKLSEMGIAKINGTYDYLKDVIGYDKLSVDGDSVVGADDVIAKLVASNPHLVPTQGGQSSSLASQPAMLSNNSGNPVSATTLTEGEQIQKKYADAVKANDMQAMILLSTVAQQKGVDLK